MKLKRIGFSRFITREWLDLVAMTICEYKDYTKIQKNLKDNFEDEPLGRVAKRKTLDVLSRIWIRVPSEHEDMRDKGLELYSKVNSTERIWLHWGMTLNAYPIFRDVASLTGRLLFLQGEVTTGQIRRGIVDNWGKRTTLTKSVYKIIQSMRDWGIIRRGDDEKIHNGSKSFKSDNPDLKLWIIEATLRAEDTTILFLTQLSRHPTLFPFKIDVEYSDLVESNRLELSQQGFDNQVIRLK